MTRVGRAQDIVVAGLYLTDESNRFLNGPNLNVGVGMTKKMLYLDGVQLFYEKTKGALHKG